MPVPSTHFESGGMIESCNMADSASNDSIPDFLLSLACSLST
jgi:hypothetical protein